MLKTFLFCVCLFVTLFASTQPVKGYKSLDPKQPIVFSGDHIIYKGETIRLGPKVFFIDRQLPDSVISKYPFVFNSVNKAAERLTH